MQNSGFPERGCSLAVCWGWLWLHAGLQILGYYMMAYCGFCSLFLPLTWYLICELSGSLRQYLFLNVPIFCFIAGAWWTAPLLGLWFALQWLPCFFLGMAPLQSSNPPRPWWLSVLIYMIALLPYLLMIPFIVVVWKDCHS